MYTVEEAKTKWCPEARISTIVTGCDYEETPIGGAACNRPMIDNIMVDNTACIADKCMHWRWQISPLDVDRINNGLTEEIIKNHGEVEPYGYCGKSGKP